MKQISLSQSGFDVSPKRTRKGEFLDEMNRMVPWAELVALIEPHYPCGKTGRPPFGIEHMLRIHFMQQWFGLSDPAMEEVLRDMLAGNMLDGVHIFFPDPWHKTRHNKRRLIQPPFVAQLVRKLKPGGYIHVATDWQDYAEQMLAVLSAEPLLENAATDYAPRPAYRPLTKFEQRGLRLGYGILFSESASDNTFSCFQLQGC